MFQSPFCNPINYISDSLKTSKWSMVRSLSSEGMGEGYGLRWCQQGLITPPSPNHTRCRYSATCRTNCPFIPSNTLDLCRPNPHHPRLNCTTLWIHWIPHTDDAMVTSKTLVHCQVKTRILKRSLFSNVYLWLVPLLQSQDVNSN